MAADTEGSEWERAIPASAVYVLVDGEPTPLDEILAGLEGGSVAVAWDDITDKPAVIGAGATQAEARTAIGAGTQYSAPATSTAAELEAGTVTAARTFTPKLIHDEIARQIAAIPAE